MSNITDTNQASEDELDTFMEQLGFSWDSYQSNWRNDGRKQFNRDYDDSISMDLAKQLSAHLRTEKLKLLDKLTMLVKASQEVNQAFHGRPDCKSCNVQEQLVEIIEAERKRLGGQSYDR